MKKILLTALCLVTLTACSSQSENTSNSSNTAPTGSQANSGNTYNFNSLVVVNNGLAEEDLEIINSDPICQLYKDNAYKVDFQLTNNFDKQINFTGITFTDIWTTSSVMTTKMSELGLEGMMAEPNAELGVVMTTNTNDIVCFAQQQNRLNLQPGETIDYPLYFSIPPNLRYEEDTATIVLGPNMHDYSDPTNTDDFSADNIELIEFEI